MKYFITYDYEERKRIRSIQSLTFYLRKGKTEEQCIDALTKKNQKDGWEHFRMIEVNEDVEAAINFLLGDYGYKYYKDITDLCDKLNDIEGDLINLENDFANIKYCIESLHELTEKISSIKENM